MADDVSAMSLQHDAGDGSWGAAEWLQAAIIANAARSATRGQESSAVITVCGGR